MRRRITLKIPTVNDESTLSGSYTTYTEETWWCNIDEIGSDVDNSNGQIVQTIQYEIILRKGGTVNDISLDYKFTYEGNDLQIIGIRNHTSRAFRVINAVSVSN